MSKKINEKALQIGTAVIWAAVLIGASLLVNSGDRPLSWELMWVIVGGYLANSLLLNAFVSNRKDK